MTHRPARYCRSALFHRAALAATILLVATTALADPPKPVSGSAQARYAYGDPSDSDGPNLGVSDYNNGNYDAAIAWFTAQLKARNLFSDAKFSRGLCYEAKHDWKSAIADFADVIAKKPQMYDAYVERGKCYAGTGDTARALADFAQAQTLKPTRPEAFQAAGDAYFNLRQYDNAVAAYTKYLALEPRPDPLVYNNRGLANFSVKRFAEAIADLNKFTALDPKDATDTSLFLGDAYSQTKQYSVAIAAYTSYTTSHPNDSTGAAINSRALAEFQAGQYKEAAADFRAYLKIHPDDKIASVDLVSALNKSGGVQESEIKSAIEYALALDPSNVALRRALNPDPPSAQDYGDRTKTHADFLAYVKGRPDVEGYKELGLEYGQAGNWKASVAAFTQEIALNPNDLEAYKDRGIAEYNLQDWKAAVADLGKYDSAKPGDEQVIKLLGVARADGADLSHRHGGPNGSADWNNLGVAYVLAKDYTNAVEAFSKSLATKRDEQVLFNRGLAYYQLGAANPAAYLKAVADASAALAIKPSYIQAQLLKADAEFSSKNLKAAQADYDIYESMSGVSADTKQYAQTQSLRIAIESQNYQSVITDTTSLGATSPIDPSNFPLSIPSYGGHRNYDQAISDLKKYTSAKPDDETGFYCLGLAYSGKGDDANAAATFEKALALKPENYDAAFQAALAYKSIADASKSDGTKAGPEYDKAIALFDKASTIKVNGKASAQADALYNEAQALEDKAKSTNTTEPLKTAVAVWAKYIAMAPNDPQIKTIATHVDALKAQIANK